MNQPVQAPVQVQSNNGSKFYLIMRYLAFLPILVGIFFTNYYLANPCEGLGCLFSGLVYIVNGGLIVLPLLAFLYLFKIRKNEQIDGRGNIAIASIIIILLSSIFAVRMVFVYLKFNTNILKGKEEKTCLNRGGEWGSWNSNEKYCFFPAFDPNRGCTDSSQCSGKYCINFSNNFGHCAKEKVINGCFDILENRQIKSICN